MSQDKNPRGKSRSKSSRNKSWQCHWATPVCASLVEVSLPKATKAVISTHPIFDSPNSKILAIVRSVLVAQTFQSISTNVLWKVRFHPDFSIIPCGNIGSQQYCMMYLIRGHTHAHTYTQSAHAHTHTYTQIPVHITKGRGGGGRNNLPKTDTGTNKRYKNITLCK